jgi:hypothetical protein
MNKGLMIGALFGAACLVGYWRYDSYKEKTGGGPMGARLTFQYNGTVSGLFKEVTSKSGVKYKVDPAVADRPIAENFQNKTVTMIQQKVAEKANVRYGPPNKGTREIPVMPKK